MTDGKKTFKKDEELLDKLSKGVLELTSNVGCTLGPRGRNVILKEKGNDLPLITKDGVTVAKFFESKDEYENLGVSIIKQASIETCNSAGDGTTTSTVLANSIFQDAKRYIKEGYSPVLIQKGMQKACNDLVKSLKCISKPISSIEDIRNIAKISSNNDVEIADLISDIVDKIGKNGTISIEKSGLVETEVDFKEGFSFNRGFWSEQFINKARVGKAIHEKPLILVTDHIIDDISDFKNILAVVDREERPVIIIAEDVRDKCMSLAILNAKRGLPLCLVRPPGYGKERKEILEDIAVSTGARFISMQNRDKLSAVRLRDFGIADRIEVGSNQTIITGGKGIPEDINERLDMIKALMEQEVDEKRGRVLSDRLNRLSSAAAIIKVGGSTKAEANEKAARVEDAVEAIRSAQVGGILPGGGMPLPYSRTYLEGNRGGLSETEDLILFTESKKQVTVTNIKSLDEVEKIGYNIVMESVYSPLQQICHNAAKNHELILHEIKDYLHAGGEKYRKGYDFNSNKVCDLLKEGIIDPFEVTKSALINAVSAAGVLITAKNAIVEK